MAKKQFKAESKKLLDLMIHSIYTNKEIFLRELISNASDAIDKLSFLALTDDKVGLNRSDFQIDVISSQEERTLTIRDNGIGMDKQMLEDNLGIIAKSGSLDFKNENDAESMKDLDIIGQFGVGFYSAFMVSDNVRVVSRAYGAEKAYVWESNGADGYTIKEGAKETVGTDVIMTLKEDTDDEKYTRFLSEKTLTELIHKYSDYIRYPIRMEVEKTREVPAEEENAEPTQETYREVDTINSMIPLWRRSKADVKKEEYDAFYMQKFMDFRVPQRAMHIRTEGIVSYDALLFIPSETPYNYYSKEYKQGLQLYSSGVMIMENCEDLLPEHFRFVKGVVDSPDVSLNISREMLQKDRHLLTIAKNIDGKIHRELTNMQKNESDEYEKFWKNFGIQIKYGVVNEYGANKESLKDLLLFASSNEEKLTNLAQYTDRMPEEQENIYYAAGDTLERIAALPQTQFVKNKGYEILYLTDEVDEFVMQTLGAYDDVPIVSVDDDELELGEQEKETLEKTTQDNKDILGFMQKTLDGDVQEVRVSNRLGEHAVVLTSEGGITLQMEQYFASMPGQEGMKAQRVLEVNTEHPIYQKLVGAVGVDDEKARDLTKILYAQAKLIAGFTIENPTEYTKLLTKLLAEG